ncbi:hypothetical protein VHEMI00653 [[Torrubiella] hemipterigena]|nr:hypothetical protein VHEMI00653 [[Torrubiella] hemipterigena]
MADKLLQHIMYECARHKINIPWDAIAHRFHPGSSGTAIVQHLNRTRRELIAEGHLVPPMTHGAEATQDLNIRGFIRRDTSGSDSETTRPVEFGEKVEDLRVSLPTGFGSDEDAEASTQPTTPEKTERFEGEPCRNMWSYSSMGMNYCATPEEQRMALHQSFNSADMESPSMDSYLTSPSMMRQLQLHGQRHVAPRSVPGYIGFQDAAASFSPSHAFLQDQFAGSNDPFFSFQVEECSPTDTSDGVENSVANHGELLTVHAVATDSSSGSPPNIKGESSPEMGKVAIDETTPAMADFLNESSLLFF